MNEILTVERELGYFERQALMEKLVHRFAAINGFKIEPDVHVLETKHPRIAGWVVMASAAIEEMENMMNSRAIEEEEIEE